MEPISKIESGFAAPKAKTRVEPPRATPMTTPADFGGPRPPAASALSISGLKRGPIIAAETIGAPLVFGAESARGIWSSNVPSVTRKENPDALRRQRENATGLRPGKNRYDFERHSRSVQTGCCSDRLRQSIRAHAVMPSQRSSVPAPVSLRQLLPWRTFAPLSSEERAPAIAFQRAVTT
jgi:hypothetical protein